MINTHTRSAMTVFRGLGDDVPDLLRHFIFPLEKNLMNRELVRWGTRHGRIEMEDRKLLTVDTAEVRSQMRVIAVRINAAVAAGLK